jgi:hypothetical protein
LQGFVVDVAEGEEAALGGVAEPDGEELGRERDVVLQDHVLDGCGDWHGGDGVVYPEREAEQAVAFVGHEGCADLGRKLDGLLLDDEAADVQVIQADDAFGGTLVAVRDFPGAAF